MDWIYRNSVLKLRNIPIVNCNATEICHQKIVKIDFTKSRTISRSSIFCVTVNIISHTRFKIYLFKKSNSLFIMWCMMIAVVVVLFFFWARNKSLFNRRIEIVKAICLMDMEANPNSLLWIQWRNISALVTDLPYSFFLRFSQTIFIRTVIDVVILFYWMGTIKVI